MDYDEEPRYRPQERSGSNVLLIVLAVVGGVGALGIILVVLIAAVITLGQNASGTFVYVGTQVSSTGPPGVEKGPTPAKTPNEALDKFREACKERDYKAAASYCTGPYLEQIDKAAEPASELGKQVDALRDIMDDHDVPSKDTKECLRLLDPFPSNFDVLEIKEDGDTATATIRELDVPEGGWDSVIVKLRGKAWCKNDDIFRSISRGILPSTPPNSTRPTKIKLKAEEKGDQRTWKIDFPVTPQLRKSVGRLCDRHRNYEKDMEKVRLMIRTKEIITQEDLEAKMKNVIAGAED
jgi:hypothetical protein